MNKVTSTKACSTLPEHYSSYCRNANTAGERVLSYAEYLERYHYVCPEDIRMLVSKKQITQ